MAQKRMGRQTVKLQNPPSVAAGACVVGGKEGEGPLRHWFDYISPDSYFGQKSWEKAESAMLNHCFSLCCDKAKLSPSDIDYLFAGDLLNQCTGSTFAARDLPVPYYGIYGACSTMAECLSLAAMALDGGYGDSACAMTSSHFCSAERQFRLPLEYGGQRPPTSQWTVTGAGAMILTAEGPGPYITHITTGEILDAGVTDANNMGAAMAPAAYKTLKAHFADTGRTPEDYDAIITGDLGYLGHEILTELFQKDGVALGICSTDCGMLIYDRAAQDVHAGGSGCGCSASVLCGHILQRMTRGDWPRVLFAATGALLSPTSLQQGESIPGICHAVVLDLKKE
ncbi:MAG: stage V sporulation protein AD [Oscillospiraceae bacterium]|nr:stage V sporulation protein AD [Oscillospiraceae bacterium]